jgi:tryptophan synthase alpha subunit
MRTNGATHCADIYKQQQHLTGGADVIELGVPFTDPQADGATIQRTNQVTRCACCLHQP